MLTLFNTMKEKLSKKINLLLFSLIFLFSFLYIILVIQPVFYFHNLQPAFLLSREFIAGFFNYPGGLSELLASLIMQSFYYKFLGPIVIFGIALAIFWLTHSLLHALYPGMYTFFLSLFPFVLTIILCNNYDLPFTIIVSLIMVLLFLLLLGKKGKSPLYNILLFTFGASAVYYFSGSGYFLIFSLAGILLSGSNKISTNLLLTVYKVGLAVFIPLIAYHKIFPIPPASKFLYFYTPKLYFMAYEPSVVFYFYLFSIPVLLSIAFLVANFKRKKKIEEKTMRRFHLKWITASLIIALFAYYSHYFSFQSDVKKDVASDYYSYHNNVSKTAKAASSMQNYSYKANLNYNLVINRAGRLTKDFFNFFQISGINILEPDYEFLSEFSFVVTDYYYDMGYISEARHWAYESLVNYPYSPRALQILTKIHFVTGEYRAAERCLNILKKELTSRSFVRTYCEYIKDTSLIISDVEIMEKRSFIPAGHELSPFIYQRYQELLDANSSNKTAYEYLMLYYLLDGDLESFIAHYKEVGNYFKQALDIYEEAILIYGAKNTIPDELKYTISPASLARYKDFNEILRQHEGDNKMARRVLYQLYGKSYLYYLQFVFPRVIIPEIISDDDKEPAI